MRQTIRIKEVWHVHEDADGGRSVRHYAEDEQKRFALRISGVGDVLVNQGNDTVNSLPMGTWYTTEEQALEVAIDTLQSNLEIYDEQLTAAQNRYNYTHDSLRVLLKRQKDIALSEA